MPSRRVLLLVLPALVLPLLVAAPASAEPIGFTDTVDTSYDDATVALAEAGIVRGCEEDRFCVDRDLTRGQVSTILAGALGLEPVDADRFGDVDGDHHAPAINALAAAGLIEGCGDGMFCGDDPLTREQLTTMLHNAFDIAAAPDDVRYFDDVEGAHAAAVNALAEAGIAAGCSERLTSFCPTDHVSRAHAAMFLARTLDLVERVDLASYDERAKEQQELDDEAEAAAAKAAQPTPGERAVEVALAQLGKPYAWGGGGPGSFDCSGLTSYAWAQVGVSLPHSSRMQYSATQRISRSELRPGDLVFYHSPISHVAMYIGDGEVVEAPYSGNQVRIREDGLTRSGIVGYGRP